MANLTLNKQVVIPDAADESDSNCSTSSGTRKSSRQKNAVDYVDLSLHKIKRRTIARPKKVISIDSSEQDIEKFYLNINKRKAVKSTNLETIFEETVDETLDDQDSSSSGSMNANGESSKTKLTGEYLPKARIHLN